MHSRQSFKSCMPLSPHVKPLYLKDLGGFAMECILIAHKISTQPICSSYRPSSHITNLVVSRVDVTYIEGLAKQQLIVFFTHHVGN
ncbi:hypothetical protein EYC80_005992 [Monilinia laxa]|uniref:Uncharacterized protein n=1 Tax=Monilinia laxa TaxID=61186 RepID=A0A5N6KG04_MONLA|nr:hypothetical protein EYC80_005992 [Monilinia laxa]